MPCTYIWLDLNFKGALNLMGATQTLGTLLGQMCHGSRD